MGFNGAMKRWFTHSDAALTSTEPTLMARLSRWRVQLGFILGPLVFVGMLFFGPPESMTPESWRILALTLLMATWWVTEALPIAVTALLPVALIPLMNVAPIDEAAAPYANPLIFLFLGGFLLAEGIQRWNLHRRLALLVLSLSGTRPDRVVGGFMAATALLSMWVSNTATAALMLPIGLSVLTLVEEGDRDHNHQNLSVALLLGIAMGANIGGMATLIGTPPNALLAGYLSDSHGLDITFLSWMAVALPLALTLLGTAWWLLTRHLYDPGHTPIEGLETLLARERDNLGPLTVPQAMVGMVFLLVAVAWLTRPLIETLFESLQLTDAGIAITGALLLFVIPSDWRRPSFLLSWEQARNLPWGVLILVGGGLALGSAIESSGLAAAAAELLSFMANWPLLLLMFAVAALIMALSHVTSNTATAATMLPLTASFALAQDLSLIHLTVPVAMAASCAFMLPVATPPNAIIFSSERISVGQMAYAGAWLSGITLLLIALWVWVVAAPVLGWVTGY
ncbi:MAG: DASS family sodium-coupled anion symporter [Halospina sp.]